MVCLRLADKALDILHHLSRRGSVWPDASAAAVRDLRARITHRQSTATAMPQSLHTSDSVDSRDNCPPGISTSEALDGTRLDTGGASNSKHPTDLPGEHPTSSTGVTFEQAASAPQSAIHPTNPPSAREFDGSERNQMYVNASAIPTNDPASDFTGFDLGSTEWNNFMQASGNGGLGPTLYAGDTMDPYTGFDIPFWLGQDQYWDMINERN
jgi:hypothetical protein